MNCPVDGTLLQMSERQGIEIDYCPKCRGVWLDRGELDKIIERSLQLEENATGAEPARQPVIAARHDRDDRRRDGYGKYHDDNYHRRRKKSFLSELLDF